MSVQINFDWKSLKFTISTLQYRINCYEKQLNNDTLSEDDISEITNDMHFLISIKEGLEKQAKLYEHQALSNC